MGKRTTKNLMHSKEDKHQRAETEQVSPKDIQRSEAVYRKDLAEVENGIRSTEKWKKNIIKRLASDLEEAYKSTGREEQIHLISRRIQEDLREIAKRQKTDEQMISDLYVIGILDQKYKQKSGPRSKDKNKDKDQNERIGKNTNSQTTVYTTSSTRTTQSQPGPIQSTEEQREEPQSLKEQRDFDDWVNNLYDLTRRLAEQITGYREGEILKLDDNFKLISETRDYRLDISKRLALLDLRTVHKEIRRDILLLNDFNEHLEKELDSRKKKEALTSE